MSDPASSFAACPMLRALSRDTGSQFALLSLLLTADIVPLVKTCRSWSHWIHEPNALGVRNHGIKPSRFPELLACKWIRLPQYSLHLLRETSSWIVEGDDAKAQLTQLYALERQQLQFALAHLGPALFPRLEELSLEVCALGESLLRDCLPSLAPRLRALKCALRSPANVCCHAIVLCVMVHVAALSKLRCLWVFARMHDPAAVSFAALPALPEIEQFLFRQCDGAMAPVPWQPSPAQVDCVARCDRLARLECGSWSCPPFWADYKAALQSRIGALAHAKRVRTDAAEASRFSTLSHLELCCTVISPPVMAHLMPLRQLNSLCGLGFTAEMTPADWAQLPLFTHLTELAIAPAADWRPSPTCKSEDYVPALVQCVGLIRLRLLRTELSAVQMTLLASSLPNLRSLELGHLWLPLASLSSLASLPQLSTLRLAVFPLLSASMTFAQLCSADLNTRPCIPALPALTALSIHEPPAFLLTSAEVAGHNAALLQRCPKLTPNKFEQNLREAEPQPGPPQA